MALGAIATAKTADELWKLPHGWEWATIEEVCAINPQRPRLHRHEQIPTSFLPMSGVDEIYGTIKTLETKPFAEVARGFTYFEEDDVLFAKITPSMENGKCAVAKNLIDGIGFGSTEFHVLRPKPCVISDWVHLYIRRISFRLEAKKHFRGAVGQQRVPDEFLSSFPIPVPPSLDIQHRIVARIEAMLAEVREARKLLEQMRRDVNQVMGAALAEVFPRSEKALLQGWHLSTIDDIKPLGRPPVQTGPFGAQLKSEEFVQTGIPVIAIGNVQWGKLDTKQLNYVTEKKSKQLSRYKLQTGDILFTRMGTVGRSCVVPSFAEGWLITYHLIRVSVDPEKVIPGFIFYCFRGAKTVIDQLREKGKGATREGVNSQILRELRLPIPQLIQQKQIVAYLDSIQLEIDEMRQLLDQDTNLLYRMEQTILERAFRGEL